MSVCGTSLLGAPLFRVLVPNVTFNTNFRLIST